jgi:hypothetical protein
MQFLKQHVVVMCIVFLWYSTSHALWKTFFSDKEPDLKTQTTDTSKTQTIPIVIQVTNTSVNTVQNTATNTQNQFVSDSTKEACRENIATFLEYVNNHKMAIAAATLITSYISLHASLVYIKWYLQKPDCWSKWLSDKSLADLYAIPQASLSVQLLNTIQHRYTTLAQPFDWGGPISRFIQDIEKEIYYLNVYRTLIKNIQYVKLNTIVWYNNSFYEEIAERLNRLAYVKSCFVNWLVEHKIEHLNAKTKER